MKYIRCVISAKQLWYRITQILRILEYRESFFHEISTYGHWYPSHAPLRETFFRETLPHCISQKFFVAKVFSYTVLLYKRGKCATEITQCVAICYKYNWAIVVSLGLLMVCCTFMAYHSLLILWTVVTYFLWWSKVHWAALVVVTLSPTIKHIENGEVMSPV